jgi:hypothetical protein
MTTHAADAPDERPSVLARLLNARDESTAQGYLFWGVAVGLILFVEALAAFAHVDWPTISSTVGHLENRWTWVAAVVVAIIAASGFLALGVPRERKTRLGYARLRSGDAEPSQVPYYTAWVPIAATLVVLVVARAFTHDKYVLGYWIYGTVAATGIVIPSVLVVFKLQAQFPSLFETIRRIHGRLHYWVATVIAAGLAVLTIHLALYPWPDITKEPTKYAGLDAGQARSKAIGAVTAARAGKAPLKYSTQARGVDNGKDAWLVFFTASDATSAYGGCVVSVTSDGAKPAQSCSD